MKRLAALLVLVWGLFTAVVTLQAEESARRIEALASLGLLSGEARKCHEFRLEATVWYADPGNGLLILQDGSGTLELQMDLEDSGVQAGDRVLISGRGTLLNRGGCFELTPLAVVDNDGMHTERELSGTVRLEAGRHPVRLDWFNASSDSMLAVEYEGPGLPRGKIPSTALTRLTGQGSGQGPRPSPGLEFRSYQERQWMLPPNQNAGAVMGKGVVEGFDAAVAGWREYVGVNFSGFLEVPVSGQYRFFLRSGDGSRLFIGPPSLRIERLARVELPRPKALFPGQPLPAGQDHLWVSLEGRVSRASRIGRVSYLWLESGAGHVRVEVADPANLPWTTLPNQPVRMTGVVQRSYSLDGIPLAATLFVQDGSQVELLGRPDVSDYPLPPPALTPVEEIERLDRPLLTGRTSARVRGVVTRVVSGVFAVVLQDRTRGIYVDMTELSPAPIQLGDLLEVSGVLEAGEFSPFIRARELTRLGIGIMPVPAGATREEMLNGRLHSQYVEIEGYVLAVDRKTVTVRTRAGTLRIDIETETSEEWLNAVVRMRGCLRVFWDAQTRQITVGKVGLDYAEISIERPAKADLFDVSLKRASELLKFDPYAVAYQRTRLRGQVMHCRGTELCLMDDGQGLRVSLIAPQRFERGDLVEIAGFPEFDGPSPHFAHALARKLGHDELRPAQELGAEALLRDAYDSTLVSVDAELLGTGFQDGRRTLQLRAGPHAFLARFDPSAAEGLYYERGSRLRLTGVYLGLGGNRSLGRPVEAFELLLASDASVLVLATPPWWSLPRLLTLVGILLLVLVMAFLWITSLRRQVAAQTEQLKVVLQERHRVQQEEALARERSRLAYDLHDELGAGLSEISMLGNLAASPVSLEKREGYLLRITDKVRRLIVSLDEIVWAVNPRYDAVSSFVGYYTAYAQQFLGLASMACRLDVAEELPDHVLTSRVRHSLFLAFKETLTNVVKHAHATEVVIRILAEGRHLVVSVSDNGVGLGSAEAVSGMDGLASIRDRMRQLEGECVIARNEPRGTTVILKLPLV